MGPLFRLMGFRFGTSFFGLGFLGGYNTLSLGLVLLRPPLATQFILTRNGSHRFFGLALHVFDNAFHSSFGTSVLVLTHSLFSSVACVKVCMPNKRSSKRNSDVYNTALAGATIQEQADVASFLREPFVGSTQVAGGLDDGPSTCRNSTSPSISKTFRTIPSSSQTTENELSAARTLLQAVTITPMMTESKKLTRLRSRRTACARSTSGWTSCSRSSSALDRSNSPARVTRAAPSETDTSGTRSACSEQCSSWRAMGGLLSGIGRMRKATQESGDHLEQTVVS